MVNVIEHFFTHLGNRIYNENRLSDVTWALCKSSNTFEQFFLDFFFENEINYEIPRKIIREYSTGDSRVDFWIRNGKNTFIIEVKIYDRNQHFEQYNIAYPNSRKGYITNYPLENQRGDEMRTWRGFYKELSQCLKNKDEIPPDEKHLIGGYIEYIKNVCSIIEIKKMDLSLLKSLQDFNLLSEEIIKTTFTSKETQSKFECVLNSRLGGTNNYTAGKHFTTYKDNEFLFVGDAWLGIHFGSSKVTIYIPHNPHESSPYHSLKRAESKNELQDGNSFNKPYIHESDEWRYYFELQASLLDEINQESTDLSRQQEIVQRFFQEVIFYVDEYMSRYKHPS